MNSIALAPLFSHIHECSKTEAVAFTTFEDMYEVH